MKKETIIVIPNTEVKPLRAAYNTGTPGRVVAAGFNFNRVNQALAFWGGSNKYLQCEPPCTEQGKTPGQVNQVPD